jgi:hypothetical protein
MARIAKALAAHLSAWEKVQRIGWTRNEQTGCLEYNGFRNEFGYGQFRSGKFLFRVHRLVYEKLVGPLASHEVVMHLCDNPSCCEVTHLSKGTAGFSAPRRRPRGDRRAHRRPVLAQIVGASVGVSAGWLGLLFGFALIWTIGQVANKRSYEK